MDRAKDASRFILYHQTAIRNWPLQVYASALIFSPVNSITKIQYQAEEPLWISQNPHMEYHWTPCLQTLEGHADEVSSVCFSRDSRLLASASTDCTVKVWNSSSGECLATLQHNAMVDSVSFSDDSGLLISASVDSTIHLWNTSNWQRIMTMEDDDGELTTVTSFGTRDSQNEKHKGDKNSIFLVSGSSDGTLKLWNTQNGKPFRTVKGHSGAVSEVTISHNYQLLASASLDSNIKIWDLTSGECIQILKEHKKAVYSIAFSHNSELFLSSSSDQILKLWKTGTWECLQTFDDSNTPDCMYSVKFSHDSRLFASGSSDDTVTLWDTSSGQHICNFSGHRSTVTSIAFSHDSKLLASASSDRTVKIWDATNRQHLNDFESHCYASPVFSDDSSILASVSNSDHYYLKIWDAHNGRCIQRIKAWSSRLSTLIYSSDLKQLAPYLSDSIVRAWDISNGEYMQTIQAHVGVRQCFLDNPDIMSFDGTMRLSSVFLEGPKEHLPLTLPDYQEFGIGVHGECITWNSECLLWLPPDYRPAGSSSTVISKSTVCICCASGRVLFFTFDSAILSQILGAPGTGKVRS